MEINPQLLKDCTSGDRKAQYQLYKQCFGMLMGVCMRYRKNEDEAAEVLNAGFLKILNNLNKYRSEVPFQAWIKRIMINTLIDDFRKNRKVKELMEYSNFENPKEQALVVDFNTADKLFDAEQIENLIKRLPPVSQKVFNMVAVDGYSHQEVSELLGITKGTSKWHLSSARKKLREMLQQAIKSSKVI